jgi:hypothetical protein
MRERRQKMLKSWGVAAKNSGRTQQFKMNLPQFYGFPQGLLPPMALGLWSGPQSQ